MKKEHPHAQVLRWIADGENLQTQFNGDGVWREMRDLNANRTHALITGDYLPWEFRIKPKTIKIGDAEIEAPIFEGEGYFISDTGEAMQYIPGYVTEAYINKQREGRVFATKNAAYAAHEAITAILTKDKS